MTTSLLHSCASSYFLACCDLLAVVQSGDLVWWVVSEAWEIIMYSLEEAYVCILQMSSLGTSHPELKKNKKKKKHDNYICDKA